MELKFRLAILQCQKKFTRKSELDLQVFHQGNFSAICKYCLLYQRENHHYSERVHRSANIEVHCITGEKGGTKIG